MEKELLEILVDLNERVLKLEKRADINLQGAITQHELNSLHAERFSEIYRKVIKLDEVYYHVFPERLRQDVRVEQQLEAAAKSATAKHTDAEPED